MTLEQDSDSPKVTALGERIPRERIEQILKREIKNVQELLALGWNLLTPKTPGVYEASFHGRPGVYRYWDGLAWSLPAFSEDAKIPSEKIQAQIRNAIFWRVPS